MGGGAGRRCSPMPMPFDGALNQFSITKIAERDGGEIVTASGSLDLDVPSPPLPSRISPAGLRNACVRHLFNPQFGVGHRFHSMGAPGGAAGPEAAVFLERVLSRAWRVTAQPGRGPLRRHRVLALRQVIATATGIPYEDFVRHEVLGPLGMTHASFPTGPIPR